MATVISPLRGMTPPALPTIDSSVALLLDPYRFIGRQAEALRSDVFRTRLMLQPALCMTGADAAALFYEPGRFLRAGAAPEPLRATLFGQGAVQGLDGERHRQRKAMFLSATTMAERADLLARVRLEWERALPAWRRSDTFSLYRALHPILTRAVCGWAGVPLAAADVERRSAQLALLFDGAATSVGAHLHARHARRGAERWLAGLVQAMRAGREAAPLGRPAEIAGSWREPDGRLLSPGIAAVELLNLLRPVVACSVWLCFVAHALHSHPGWREHLAAHADRTAALRFAQEVRRHYPFFPAVVARVAERFEWRGLVFPAGARTLLDLYGTHHDPRWWHEPDRFHPLRWATPPRHPFAFIPQGGGDPETQHHCPGDDLALQLMMLGLDMFTRGMRYDIARPGDTALDWRRLPALPRDGLLINAVVPA